MSCAEDFESICGSRAVGMDPNGLVRANAIIAVAMKANRKHPLLFLPDFVEDLVEGVLSRKIMEKHHIHTYNDFATLVSLLKMNGRRSKSAIGGCKRTNLALQGWDQQYEILTSQFSLFRTELVGMFNCSVLRGLIAHAILRLRYIPSDAIERHVLDSYRFLKTGLRVPRDAALDAYMQEGLALKIDSIITRMSKESLITRMDWDVSMPAKYADMGDVVREFVGSKTGGMQYQSLVTKILGEFPLIRLLPDRNAIDRMLDSLEQAGIVIRKRTFKKLRPYSDQLFAADAYRAAVKKARTQAASAGRIKFFGRRISPDRFVSELRDLDPGDIDDQDDQVTRMAGLVLADAVTPQSPTERASDFDFMVDTTNYNFRPEQEALMKKLDFEVRSSVFHCKVMINEEVTPKILSVLKKAVPAGEQGVVFTCTDVSQATKAKSREDRIVQVIDAEGIREWCSITQAIPCRKNSVARVMYGDAIGRVVMVRSLNYESGMATVAVAPDSEETTLPMGCFKEIGPDARVAADEFGSVSESFFNMICSLASLSPGTFEDGVAMNAPAVYHTREAMLRATHPELLTNPALLSTQEDEPIDDKHVVFDTATHTTVSAGSAHTLSCTCGHNLNQGHRATLCIHLVASILAVASTDPNPARVIACINKSLKLSRVRHAEKIADDAEDAKAPQLL